MTYKTYAEFVRSADERPFELFRARWLLLPDCESITGWDPADLDHGAMLLQDIHGIVNRPISDIRAAAGLTQQDFGDRFAIPIRTVQNWESQSDRRPHHQTSQKDRPSSQDHYGWAT